MKIPEASAGVWGLTTSVGGPKSTGEAGGSIRVKEEEKDFNMEV